MENLETINTNIHELQAKYEAVIKKLDDIQEQNTSKEDSLKQLEDNFQIINDNIEALMLKVDSITIEKEKHIRFNSIQRSNFSVINMIVTPMRKATITTMRTIFTMADYASQKVSYAKEELEDIITEAQAENKKRKAYTIPNEQL